MFKNNLFSVMTTIILIALITLLLPILSFMTAYVNSDTLKAFHYSFLIVILLAYNFVVLFRVKRFYLMMISFTVVAFIWFTLFGVSQGITTIIPSFSFVLTISIINLLFGIIYTITLIKEYKKTRYEARRKETRIYI
jgi:hypothetical protein